MDGWQPGDSGWAIGTMAGGPFDGCTYGDLPKAPDGEAPSRVSIPTEDPSGPFALYDRQAASDDGRWLYLFLGVSAAPGSMEAPLPTGSSVHFPTRWQPSAASLPALRFRVAQGWWIASELVRRHAGRHLLETEGDVLQVVRPADEHRAAHNFCRLDRAAGVLADGLQLDWAAVLAADSPHDVVRSIEQARHRVLRGHAPATTPRALTYRVAARLLATRVDDRAVWDVRGDLVERIDGVTVHGYLHGFPSALTAVASADERPTLIDAAEHFWGVLRNGEVRAVLDDAGVLHGRHGALDLVDAYRRRRRLQDVMAGVQEVLSR